MVFNEKFVTIVLTFSLKIILRQFLCPFHKDYRTTNFNLTTKITLTITNYSQTNALLWYGNETKLLRKMVYGV
jgi:hypothetical protein